VRNKCRASAHRPTPADARGEPNMTFLQPRWRRDREQSWKSIGNRYRSLFRKRHAPNGLMRWVGLRIAYGCGEGSEKVLSGRVTLRYNYSYGGPIGSRSVVAEPNRACAAYVGRSSLTGEIQGPQFEASDNAGFARDTRMVGSSLGSPAITISP